MTPLADSGFPSTTELIHESVGRVRLGSPIISESPGLADALKRHLSRLSGVGLVRISNRSASIVVHHDDGWSASTVLEQVETLGLLGLGSRSIVRRTVSSIVGERRLTVDALDTAAIGLLAVQGLYPYAAFITTMVAVTEVIRGATQEKSRQAIADVLGDMRSSAWVERDGETREVDADDVMVGEIVTVSAGDRIPADGVVIEGKIIVDQQALTGESVPVTRESEQEVFATTAVVEGQARIVSEGVGSDTRVAQIVQLISNAPAPRSTKSSIDRGPRRCLPACEQCKADFTKRTNGLMSPPKRLGLKKNSLTSSSSGSASGGLSVARTR